MLAGACFQGWVRLGYLWWHRFTVHGSPVLRLVVTMKTESQRLFFCFHKYMVACLVKDCSQFLYLLGHKLAKFDNQ